MIFLYKDSENNRRALPSGVDLCFTGFSCGIYRAVVLAFRCQSGIEKTKSSKNKSGDGWKNYKGLAKLGIFRGHSTPAKLGKVNRRCAVLVVAGPLFSTPTSSETHFCSHRIYQVPCRVSKNEIRSGKEKEFAGDLL